MSAADMQPPSLPFIDLKAQYRDLKTAIDARIHAVLDHGQYILGPEVAELEQRLAARVGVKHCITCSSGTDALLLALMVLGVGAGSESGSGSDDEIITSPFSFFATGEVIALLGAKPVFVDIEPNSYNLDPKLIEAAITPNTRAIMPVSLYGQPAEMDAINAIAAAHNLPVIEDAAQSFGSLYKGRHSCGLSTIGCTSFFPSKPLGCYGDGGACFTEDDALALRMHQLRNHGQQARYQHTAVGINGRFDTLQAAILLAKLDVFDRELIARDEVANAYTGALLALAKKGKLRLPELQPGRTSAWAQYTVEVDNREAVAKAMGEAGVPTAVHYPIPMHKQPVFAAHAAQTLPHAEVAAARVLSLPLHPYLGRPQLMRIADALEAALG